MLLYIMIQNVYWIIYKLYFTLVMYIFVKIFCYEIFQKVKNFSYLILISYQINSSILYSYKFTVYLIIIIIFKTVQVLVLPFTHFSIVGTIKHNIENLKYKYILVINFDFYLLLKNLYFYFSVNVECIHLLIFPFFDIYCSSYCTQTIFY